MADFVSVDDADAMPGTAYTECKRGGDTVGGMMDMPAAIPPRVPATRRVSFAVVSDRSGDVFAVTTVNAAA
ncbi:MAG TPA: hypothetical protein VMV22_01820 [Acidimicrobiales bacterium]|nr:hypothetical protein [Acidimicrobiales bacterium]